MGKPPLEAREQLQGWHDINELLTALAGPKSHRIAIQVLTDFLASRWEAVSAATVDALRADLEAQKPMG